MDHQYILNEINYHRAQKLTEQLYASGLISFDEYDKRKTFSPIFSDLLPKTLDKSCNQS